MDPISTLLAAIRRDPHDDTAWLALADALAEDGQDDRAEMARLLFHLRQPVVADPLTLEARLLELWERGVTACLPHIEGPWGISFVLIPPGSFWMGATDDEPWMDRDELPQRRVHLPHAFYLATTPITQHQWEAVLHNNPSHHRGPQLPVESVSYWEARRFCNLLQRHLNLPCRLPSEFEWECACRAGTSSMYASGNGLAALRKIGWCSYNGEWDASGGTCQVASLRPNAWGLFDMHGNVWEWCANIAEIPGHPALPLRPAEDAGPLDRVVRGGSYRGGPWFCRSAERNTRDPSVHEVNIGFRIVLDAEPHLPQAMVAADTPALVS